LLDGPAQHIGLYGEPGGLASVVAEVMLEQGWAEDHRPLREWSVERAIHEPLRELRLFGLLAEDPAGRDVLGRRLTVGLTDSGKAAAWAHLYRRATEPRSRILE
jgi:hypothetical protein